MRLYKKVLAAGLAACLAIGCISPGYLTAAGATSETPARTFSGTLKASALLSNISYTDVRNSTSFARDAVYETGALELLKGSLTSAGTRVFGLQNTLSVDQALAAVYNMVGREAEAQQAAQALDLARAANARLYPAPRMWSDGYIQLAYNDGLITLQDYYAALGQTGTGSTFNRSAAVTREDLAYYAASVMKLVPVNSQTNIFNSYRDWNQSNPHRIPQIEALLQNKIMSGDTNGYFRPKASVTRAELAQIIVNAEPVLFTLLGYEKFTGTIEDIISGKDMSNGNNRATTTLNIRSSGGDLHTLTGTEELSNGKNEQTGQSNTLLSSSVVLKSGSLGLLNTLKPGDFIRYISNAANEVVFIQVIPSEGTRYYLGRVGQVDTTGKTVEFSRYLELPYPDIRTLDSKTLNNLQPTGAADRYSVSNSARVYDSGSVGDLSTVKARSDYILTVKNGLVESFDLVNAALLEDKGMATGVVRENNPSLGYMTLYFADGSGTSPTSEESLTALRNFLYGYDVPVTRDGVAVSAESILPGDFVFVKLDDDGYITGISAKSYYNAVEGTLYTKTGSNITVKKSDGSFVSYTVSSAVPIYKNGYATTLSEAHTGDSIRLYIQSIGGSLFIGSIDVEKNPQPITGLYRGTLENYNTVSDSLVVSGVKEFVNGRWENASTVGMVSLTFNGTYKDRPGRVSAGGTVYYAIKKDVDGKDKIVAAAYRSASVYETLVSDNVLSVQSALKTVAFENLSDTVYYDENTLVVRDGRLVDMTSLSSLDPVKASLERASSASGYIVPVLVSETGTQISGLTVYRGRIKAITPSKTVTVESFAQLSGITWNFTNTPKTFDLDISSTRFLADDGVTNVQELNDTYLTKTVYIVADGTRTRLISTAGYANTPVRGRIGSVTVNTSEDGTATGGATVTLNEAMTYSSDTFVWKSSANITVTLPENAIVLRKGQLVEPGALKKGDSVRILNLSTGNTGIIVLCD